jgi:ATP-dependent Lon protease
LTSSGKLGETMKESLEVAKVCGLNYLITNLDYKKEELDQLKIHVHLPKGAEPKDGPSCGLSLFIALVSLVTKTPVKTSLALTGEISTLGEVIKIGKV